MITVNRKILQFKSVQHFAGSLTELTLLLKIVTQMTSYFKYPFI